MMSLSQMGSIGNTPGATISTTGSVGLAQQAPVEGVAAGCGSLSAARQLMPPTVPVTSVSQTMPHRAYTYGHGQVNGHAQHMANMAFYHGGLTPVLFGINSAPPTSVPPERDPPLLWNSTIEPAVTMGNPPIHHPPLEVVQGVVEHPGRLMAPPHSESLINRYSAALSQPTQHGTIIASKPELKPDHKAPKAKQRYKCNLCPSDFGQKGSLGRHIKTVHEGARPYPCPECGFAFQQRYDLKNHVQTVHGKEKPFKCTWEGCKSSFARRAKLQQHIRAVHENIRPYLCAKCKSAFAEKSNLLKHVRSVHQNIRPFQCSRCGTRFKERGHLKKHLQCVHMIKPDK